jgi:hypothetical protein
VFGICSVVGKISWFDGIGFSQIDDFFVWVLHHRMNNQYSIRLSMKTFFIGFIYLKYVFYVYNFWNKNQAINCLGGF